MAADKTPQPLDYTFTAPIEKDGAFATFLALCKAIGKSVAGEEVSVRLQQRLT
ncbi:hypothetical protein [Rhodococcus erythropolis]|uniref:hypothetical protein n=1 Tax=Rhodococcus erythropolis TaxID=1833 RepID=UPI001BE636E9|nr:hypothetical protein [Rhodococcus erythropolis]MBT2269485.1 hypothetical protein [Rhodococcus erythropolis]